MKSSFDTIHSLFTENEFCRQFIEISPDAIIIIAPDGEIILFNRNARELFGYDENMTVPPNVLMTYRNPSQREELMSSLMLHGAVQGFEAEFITADGGTLTACVNVSVAELGGHSVHIASVRDISVRKAVENNLKKSEKKFSSLFDAASDAILILDESGQVIDCNQTAVQFFHFSRQELLKKSFLGLSPLFQPTGKGSDEIFFENLSAALNGENRSFLWQHQLKDGGLSACNISLKIVEVGAQKLLMCVVYDLSEQQRMLARVKLDEVRFEALSALSKMGDVPLTSIYDYALEAAVNVTGSKIGYIYFLNEDETELMLHAWSRSVMPQCAVDSIPDRYKVEDVGVWGDAIRLRKPVIINDYAGCLHKNGIPEGHVPVIRHMNVPLFDNDRIVLLAGVGNKEEDYTDDDVRQLTLLMEGMWNTVRRKQSEDALRAAYSGLEKKVFERTEKLSFALSDLQQSNREIKREVEFRKEVEKQLKVSAGRLSLATRAGGIGVWEWDIAAGNLVWDDRMYEIYHCSPDDFYGSYESWISLIYSADRADVERALNDATKGDGHFECEFRVRWPDGEIRYITAAALTLYDSEGLAQSMTGINLDVTERRRLEERLRRFESIISVTPDMVSLVNSNYEYVMVNDSYVRSFGRSKDYFIGRNLGEVLGRDIFETHSKPMIDAAFSGESPSFEAWLDVPDVGMRFLSVTYQPVDSAEDDERFVSIVAHDVTAMKLAQEDRQHIFEVSLDMLCVASFGGRFIELNPAWSETLGWGEDELKQEKWIDLVHPEDREKSVEVIRKLLTGLIVRNFENRYMCKDGSWRWVSWSLHADLDQEKVTAVGRDVTLQKSMVDDLKRMARTDVLTGANNRRFFFDRAKEEVDRIRRYGGGLGLMMLDIDHFKTINDTYGHDVGDLVLKELVKCSLKTLRVSDVFGRIGGEEFAVLLVQGNIDSAIQAAERLRKDLGQLEIRADGAVIKFTVSIGLTWVGPDNPSVAEAMKQADRCLYRAKREGRNRVVSYY